MALNKRYFQSARSNARGPNWSYITTDSLSTIRGAGYFNGVSSLLTVGDEINIKIVDDVTTPAVLKGIYTVFVWTNSGGTVKITCSRRDASMPTLLSRQPQNAICWYEDFNTGVAAPLRFAEGDTATPNTYTHQAAFGNPTWVGTSIQGTTNQIGVHGSDGDENYLGCFSIQAGTTSGDGIVVDLGGRSSTSPGNDISVLGHATIDSVMQWRFRLDAATDSHILGMGWITGIAQGTDWLTDPDTVLGTSSVRGLIIHRNSATYSGDNAGDLVARFYDGNTHATDTSLVLCAAGSFGLTSADWHKVEVESTGGNLLLYYNEVYKGTISASALLGDNFRPVMGFKRTSSGGTRALRIDSYIQEVSSPTYR